MSTTTLSVSYRPVRIGFLVRDGNIDDIVKAAGINTLLWGGIYNPIIPVSDNLEFAECLIKLFNVDVIYPFYPDKDKNIKTIYERFPLLGKHTLRHHKLFSKIPNTNYNTTNYFDSMNIITYYWENEFKHSHDNSNCILVNWGVKSTFKDLYSVWFGYYPDGYNLYNDFKRSFLELLCSKEYRIINTRPLSRNFLKKIYPIEITREKIHVYCDRFDYGIYVGDENNFDDLINFWNLRASGKKVIFLPLERNENFTNFAKSFDKTLDHNYFLNIYYFNKDKCKIKKTIHNLNFSRDVLYNELNIISWNGLYIIPKEYKCDEENVLAHIDNYRDKYFVFLKLPQKPFTTKKNLNNDFQRLVTSVNSLGEFGYRNHTINPPFIQELNDFYQREIALLRNELRIEKDGIGIITEKRNEVISLFPIPHQQLIEKIFEYVGFKATLSQPGLITLRIIEKMGGLEATRIFKIRGVRKLIKSFKSEEHVSKKTAEEKIWNDSNFEKYKKLYIEERDKRELTKEQVFKFLLKNDIFRAGLELKCNYCNLKNWISLKRIDDWWECDYCGYKNQTSIQLLNKDTWKFRKTGLFSKDNNQEGAIPVIITLLQLLRTLDFSKFIYSSSLNLYSDIFVNKQSEIDLCVLHYGRRNKIEIGIAECKDESGKIEKTDIENIKTIRKKFMLKDIECYPIFSKTSDNFDDDEIILFQELKEDDIPFILFSNKELEPYDPY